MTQDAEAREIYEQVKAYRARKPRGRLPDAVQKLGQAYARKRREMGGSWAQIGTALGVLPVTAQQWAESASIEAAADVRQAPALLPILVSHKSAPPRVVADRIEVEFPNGVRLRATGLSEPTLERLVQTMGRFG